MLDPSTPFVSEAVVAVHVASQTLGGAHGLDETYEFTAEDRTAPRVVGAQAVTQREVQIGFDEAVLVSDPAGFDFEAQSFPAVPVAPTSASANGSVVTLSLDTEMTSDVAYGVVVSGASNGHGNPVLLPDDTMTFLGFRPPRPAT